MDIEARMSVVTNYRSVSDAATKPEKYFPACAKIRHLTHLTPARPAEEVIEPLEPPELPPLSDASIDGT